MRSALSNRHVGRMLLKTLLACGSSIICVSTASAACDGHNPASGETVTCDTADTLPVIAQPGASDVTIIITPAGDLSVLNSNGVAIGSQSQLTNDGRIAVTGIGSGVASQGAGNVIINSGSISSATASGIGLAAGGTVTNAASGTISGVTGITSTGAGAIVTNSGTITGTGGTALQFTGAFNNELTSSGTITGNVVFGSGNDRTIVTGGNVTGLIDQGDGTNYLEISGGTAGNVFQRNDIDEFVMTGGQITALNQGNGFDEFAMSGGRITGAFEDGDFATMTGGRIGRVDMKLANNTFDMSGGAIDNNLVAGLGNDTIILSDGTIGGNISISSGTDSLTVTGGYVGGEIRMGQDEDVLVWDGGGIIDGAIDMNDDDDIATLRNLTAANLGTTPLVDGGTGNDALAFDHTESAGIARFKNWESIDVTNGSTLTFDGDVTLGDAGTGTGTFAIDSGSRVFGGGGNYSIMSLATGQLATVTNAGTIDLTNGAPSAANVFTIVGNYVGAGGQVRLQTVLGDDSSASDRLAISGGTATGTTGLTIINMGGQGAATAQNGIMVVEALNGATTASSAFALNNQVAVGAFEYLLFKGGVTAGTADNWYLRSTLPTPPAPTPEVPEPPMPVPAPAPSPVEPAPPPPPPVPPEEPAPPPTPPVEPPAIPVPPVPPTAEAPEPPPPPPPPTPGATPSTAEVVPLYRVEVPVYAVAAAAAQQLGLTTLGTFHERQGDQQILAGNTGILRAGWGRIIGEKREQSWSGTVSPSFDGSLYGFQAGLDLFAHEGGSGSRDRAGLFFGKARMDGDVRGFALGWDNLTVGKLKLDETSAGAYWTHIGSTGWYLDAVGKLSWFDGSSRSARDIGVDLDGKGVTVSLEAGYPFEIDPNWVLEPQAQLVWQHLSLKDGQDTFSPVAFDSDDGLSGRLGFRLRGSYPAGGAVLQPYLRVNMWHAFGATDRVSFGVGDPILTNREATSVDLGGGLVAQMSSNVSLYAAGDYTTNMSHAEQNTLSGTLGVRISW